MNQKSERKSRKPFVVLAVILVLVASIGGYFWVRSAAFETTDDAQVNGDIYSVRSGIAAYLDTIRFKDNQHVKKGDTLFVFDLIPFQARVTMAKAALANAKAGLSTSDLKALAQSQHANASEETLLAGVQNIVASKASLDKMQSDFDRAEKMVKIKAVTQKDYEAAQTALEQAKAEYDQTIHNQQFSLITSKGLKSEAKAAHQQISSTAAIVTQREAELQLTQEQLSHGYVLAPCNGIVTKRAVEEGQYVMAGQSLCAVVDEEHLWITANFKETQLKSIKPGQPVVIKIDAYPDLDLKGIVESYGGATGAMFSLIPPDNASGNFIKVTQRFPLRIGIPSFFDGKIKPNVLFPGLSAFVKVNIQ